MATHELKSWPGQFQAMWTGLKRAEFRRDDRSYQVGDLLELREWDPSRRQYTGFRLTARVMHLVRGPELEVPAGVVVLSIEGLGGRVVDSGSPPGCFPSPGPPPRPRPPAGHLTGGRLIEAEVVWTVPGVPRR